MKSAESLRGARKWNLSLDPPSGHPYCAAPSINGLWLSLVERFVRDEEAAGSNPASPTIITQRPLPRVRLRNAKRYLKTPEADTAGRTGRGLNPASPTNSIGEDRRWRVPHLRDEMSDGLSENSPLASDTDALHFRLSGDS